MLRGDPEMLDLDLAYPQYVCYECDPSSPCKATNFVSALLKRGIIVMGNHCDERLGPGIRDILQRMGLWERTEIRWERDSVMYILKE